jgi:hypothetical protein
MDERLADLLHEIVADVDAPPLARAAWEGAARVRRRRRIAAAAAATAVVAGVVPVLAQTGDGTSLPARPVTPPPAGGTTPDDGATPRAQPGPERADVPSLPGLQTLLADLGTLPGSAVELAEEPAPRLFAAAQRPGGPVLVIGMDRRWRQVGTPAGGRPLLSPTSISSDGTRLALSQPGNVVLVDVHTGRLHRLPVTGPMARSTQPVSWLGDQEVLVGEGAGQVVLSVADGRQRSIYAPRDQRAVGQWYSGPWPNGDRIAATGFRHGDDAQVVAVFDAATGRVQQLLDLPYGTPPATRSNGCCATLGWLDDETVLLRDGGYVLAWRPDSGEVLRIARLPGTSTEGADPGYDTTLAVSMP